MSASKILHLAGTVVIDQDTTANEVWISGGKFTFTKPVVALGQQIQTITGTVLAGLVDAHCHIGLDAHGPTTLDAARQQATTDRETGVLLIRDCGSPLDTTALIGTDQVGRGIPRLIRCGQHIARSRRYLRNYALELENSQELPQALSSQAERGDGWTKIVADWIDREVGDLTPLWERGDLIAGIAAAHASGAKVTAHTFATESIDDLFDAGIDCIEHGTGMTPAHMERAAAMGVPVTASLLQVTHFSEIAAQARPKFPLYANRMSAMYNRRHEQVLALYNAGVQILVGTDAGGTIAHGQIAHECQELVRAGIPASEVVGFATYQARKFLGHAAIAQGAPGDAVVYGRDPRVDITELTRPQLVILGGKVQQ